MFVVGALLVLMGSIWFLQGINVLTAGNSPMIGDIRWAYYGSVAVAIGIALVVAGRRRR
jgi:hypothetical protein